MNNKWIKMAGVAAAVAGLVSTVQAVPTLTLSDNLGNTVNGVPIAPGTLNFTGAVGNWFLNVTTGSQGGTAISPTLDLNTVNHYNGNGTGSILTITYTVDNLGPFAGGVLNDVGGTENGVNDTFVVLVNGVPVTSQSFTGTPFSGSASGLATVGAGSTITIRETFTARPGRDQITSSDDRVSLVPDGGTTVMLLGAALSGFALIRRKLTA